ncbi:MAG: pilus assembly protein N-terminal domain-containing protein [Phenylobacterium sp.]|uniref:type II and III secretion system protein family protein n=1 Tax=Phenylobacterium sp. TaxID=1871053 RepID=UPI0027313E89|nr:pilus assembly protein N-terminal domain-containing protein [Phenylobacterium sp.]MDP2010527.1 pilus assembly protein N-terminal domain-containing protein [Phenylobacterium sp.]
MMRHLVLAAVVWALASPALAQVRNTISEGGFLVLTPSSDVSSVVMSNDATLKVDVRGARRIVLFGVKEGSADVMLMNAANQQIERRTVEVVADTANLAALISRTAQVPNLSVSKSSGVAVLTGDAPNAATVVLAGDIATGAMPGVKIINLIRSATNDQLAVSVRVLEVRRNKAKELGIRWQAQNRFNGGTGAIGNLFASAIGTATTTDLFASAKFTIDRLVLDTFLNYLRSEGAATMLAEPTIVATSGQKARFLAGGELPVPSPQTNGVTNNAVGYTYKPYGVTLEFTALIVDGESVRLQLAPEVSQVDMANIVEFNGAKVPSLITRKTETTVTLKFGESVAIAGLRSSESQSNKRGLPFRTPFDIGDKLAGSRDSRDSDTELVLIVTPERVEDAAKHMPSPAVEAKPSPLK